MWERKEYSLLSFTYYVVKCTAGLDRKNKYKPRKPCFACLGHHKFGKVPHFIRSTWWTALRKSPCPPQTASSERRCQNHTKIFPFGKKQNWNWGDSTKAQPHCKKELELGMHPPKRELERQRPSSWRGNCRRMWQPKGQLGFRGRTHSSHIAGCSSPLSAQR